MASLKTICVSFLGLAFVGFAVQLGGLASMADTGCRGSTTPAAMPAYNAFSTSVPTNFVTRRLQQHVPTKFELTSRCNIRLSLDWWSVFYQFCIIAFALFAAFTERMFQARVRVSLLFGIAIAWVAIQANNYLPNVTTRTNAIRDAEVYEQDVTPTNKDWVNFISTRTYIAGTIISAISYFCFIIFGLGEFSSA